MKHRLAPLCIDETLPAVILSDLTKTTSRKPQPPKLMKMVGRKKTTAQALYRRETEGFHILFWPGVLDQSPIVPPFVPC